jgi:hypothetical protein
LRNQTVGLSGAAFLDDRSLIFDRSRN